MTNEEKQASGPQAGAIDSQALLHQREHDDWKRRQAIQPSAGTWLSPTLPERINRLNPSERHQLSSMIRSIKLRKIIRRILAEAFWARETQTVAESLAQPQDSMQRLRAAVRAQESLKSYESALTTFEPVVTHSRQPTLIEVP